MNGSAFGKRVLGLFSLLVGFSACRSRAFDSLTICILPSSDRVVVEAAAGCASDHKGAELSCKIDRDGDALFVTTSGHDGRDRDDACARDLTTICESEPLTPGEYDVFFEDERFAVVIPNEHDFCADTTSD